MPSAENRIGLREALLEVEQTISCTTDAAAEMEFYVAALVGPLSDKMNHQLRGSETRMRGMGTTQMILHSPIHFGEQTRQTTSSPCSTKQSFNRPDKDDHEGLIVIAVEVILRISPVPLHRILVKRAEAL